MITREAEYKECKGCGSRKRITEEIYGCDWCGKTIDYNNPGERSYLEVTAFTHEKGNVHHHLCSWRCVWNILPTLKSDYFISFPHISYDEGGGISAREFFKVFYPNGKPKRSKKWLTQHKRGIIQKLQRRLAKHNS
jgi:hypothetical protein